MSGRHSSIRDVAFKHDVEGGGLPENGLAVECNESSHVNNPVLFTAHGHPVGQGEHLFYDLPDGPVLVTFFPGFDEIDIFRKTGSIEDHRNPVPAGKIPYCLHVFHAYGLSTGGIAGDGNNDKRDALLSIHLEHIFKFSNIQVALEGMVNGSVIRLVNGTVKGSGFPELDVPLGGIKVCIAGYHMFFFDQD